MTFEQNKQISEAVSREESRLRHFIRRRSPHAPARPAALDARNGLGDELELAVDELPLEQHDVFVAHELEGRSFKEIAAETGENINTLLSRKRYAVLTLRKRLLNIYDGFKKG